MPMLKTTTHDASGKPFSLAAREVTKIQRRITSWTEMTQDDRSLVSIPRKLLDFTGVNGFKSECDRRLKHGNLGTPELMRGLCL